MTSTETISAHLIEACKKGDQFAYSQIYQRCAKGVFNSIHRIVKNREEAEDLLQETFINAFGAIQTFRGDASFYGWIKRIGINKSLNSVKKRKLALVDQMEAVENWEDEKEDWEEVKLEVNQIINKMELLPEGFRLVLTLYLFEEYSHKEIAEELGISESTSKTQYLRGKKKLKELLTTH